MGGSATSTPILLDSCTRKLVLKVRKTNTVKYPAPARQDQPRSSLPLDHHRLAKQHQVFRLTSRVCSVPVRSFCTVRQKQTVLKTGLNSSSQSQTVRSLVSDQKANAFRGLQQDMAASEIISNPHTPRRHEVRLKRLVKRIFKMP